MENLASTVTILPLCRIRSAGAVSAVRSKDTIIEMGMSMGVLRPSRTRPRGGLPARKRAYNVLSIDVRAAASDGVADVHARGSVRGPDRGPGDAVQERRDRL